MCTMDDQDQMVPFIQRLQDIASDGTIGAFGIDHRPRPQAIELQGCAPYPDKPSPEEQIQC